MDKILKSIMCFMESMGRARAAGQFARMGRADLAKAVMEEKCQSC